MFVFHSKGQKVSFLESQTIDVFLKPVKIERLKRLEKLWSLTFEKV